MRKIPHYLLFCLFMFILVGCTKKAVSIIGVWQSENADEITVEFKRDGTLTEYWQDVVTAEYTYEVGGDQVTINQNGDLYTVTIEDGTLIYMGDIIYRYQGVHAFSK